MTLVDRSRLEALGNDATSFSSDALFGTTEQRPARSGQSWSVCLVFAVSSAFLSVGSSCFSVASAARISFLVVFILAKTMSLLLSVFVSG